MLKTQVILKEKFTRMEDLANASGTVNGDFQYTQTEPEWQKWHFFKDCIQRTVEKLKNVAISVDDDSESASNSIAQVTSGSFEAPTFTNAPSSSNNIINNELLVPAQDTILKMK